MSSQDAEQLSAVPLKWSLPRGTFITCALSIKSNPGHPGQSSILQKASRETRSPWPPVLAPSPAPEIAASPWQWLW